MYRESQKSAFLINADLKAIDYIIIFVLSID